MVISSRFFIAQNILAKWESWVIFRPIREALREKGTEIYS